MGVARARPMAGRLSGSEGRKPIHCTPPASMTKRGGFAGTRSNMVATEDLTASGATGTRTRAAGGSYPGALTVTIKPVPSGGDPARDADMLAFF